MAEDIDVSEFGETATEGMGKVPEGGEEIPGDSPTGGGDVWERMFSTTPNPPVESVESPFNPEAGGLNRVMRGVMKMGDIEGLPAFVDILIGLMEFGLSVQRENSGDKSDSEMSGGSLDESTDIQLG